MHDNNDHVSVQRDISILLSGSKITQIGRNITPPSRAEIIDCKSKIIAPGFVDTHHHVWQTPLKARHSNDTLLDYHPRGNLQYYNYTPEDVFWSELGGLLEAIDAGTTTIVDHAHLSKTADHVRAGPDATFLAWIRSVFAMFLL